MNYQEKMDEMISKLKKGTTPKLLLHACCAPCSSYCIEYLSNYFKITIYYYNPNIDTKEEFDKRAEELKRFVSQFQTKNPVNVVVENYDNSEYEEAIKGHEEGEEGSPRCYSCYELRMRKAALYAKKNKYRYFTTTLSISPYKNSDWLNEIGEKLGTEFNLKYLYADFKKKNGYKRSIELSKEYGLYRQDYCGCKRSKIVRDKREVEKREREKEEELRNQLSMFVEAKEKRDKQTKAAIKEGLYHFSDVKTPLYKKISVLFLSLVILFLAGYAFSVKLLPHLKIWVNGLFAGDIGSALSGNPKVVKPVLNIKETSSNLNEIYIYGSHLNMKGDLEVEETIAEANIVFVSDSEIYKTPVTFKMDENILNYYISDKVNGGYRLDNLPLGNYEVYLETISDNTSHYKINNTTNYLETPYYTVTDTNGKVRKVLITSANTLKVNVSENKDDVYDVILDAGHGGIDTGACRNGHCETEFTLPYVMKLKSYLEEYGYKVALTRTTETKIDDYNNNGRVNKVIESFAKLCLSIHLNNLPNYNYGGFEFYTPYNVDYSFARTFVSSMNELGLPYSVNTFNKVASGLYTRTMRDTDLASLQADANKKNYSVFKATLETNYYFMIRETGGYITGAYRDGRDGSGVNYHVTSNHGVESYIFEMGYIGNSDDINFLNANNEKVLRKVAENINNYLRNNT